MAPPVQEPPAHLGERVVRRCLELGFAAAGVTDARPTERAAEFSRWLAAGKHGSMHYLERHAEIKKDPALFLPGAASIVMVADQYAIRGACDEPMSEGNQPQGKIARYARGSDYHEVIKKRLHVICDELRAQFPAEQFRAFVDTAPVMEREHAARAGLGWIAKHTLVIHPRLGSWLLLGGFITTLRIDAPAAQIPAEDHCGTCTRCIDACPTSAITPYSVDATRCISYLTIEQRSGIDPDLEPGIGDWLFGCDICQEVCPHNSPRALGVQAGSANPAYTPRSVSLPLLEVLAWNPEDRSRDLSRSAIKRATLAMLKRNAIIAAGNAARSGTIHPEKLTPRLAQIAADAGEDAMVREQAERTLGAL
ncbi:MAG: tRNA epoxyqueuosine(34) reductase QueG [Phycisphaerales bacterium]|nr:tRNA epoxyqueuosine(34) reductase QueG [Phycisphaerales bacterium]